MPRLIRLALLLLAALAAAALSTAAAGGPAAAQAGEAASDRSRTIDLGGATLRATGSTAASCLDRRTGTDGVVTHALAIPAAGYVYATLAAAEGDWDVAVFDASGQRVAGGTSPGAREIASGYVGTGGNLTVQACRRSGGAGQARLAATFTRPAKRKPGRVQLVDVKTRTRADKQRLVDLGVDLTEHGHEGALGVVLHGAADAEKLRRAGFTWEVEVEDVVARSARDRSADARFAQSVQRSDLPSGRDSYRRLEDYNAEMKKLAEENPSIVRLFEMPNKTFEGRVVMGLEITTDVQRANGKPAFLNMGLHHAREWPSGEHAMEWAYELINGFKRGDARVTRIMRGSRNIVVPVVNPDGFNASRTAGAVGGDGGRDESVPDTAYLVAGAANGGEYRRKNCRLPTNAEAGNCATSAGLAEPGVDPNRNYGGLWGGPGADATNVLAQTYRGPGPFSEPETKNVKWLVGNNQVVTLITNHTTAGLVLRAPGLAALGEPVDERRGYKALGDELSLHNGYFSQKSYELYDTTGTTEDWTYNTAGGFGFTFEIYCGAPDYETGDCNDPAFHPRFATMVKEWTGDSEQANHVKDPGRSNENPFGNVAQFDGKGNREAYYIAAESTLNEARHSVIEGEAPEGARLRIRKTFKTETFPQDQPSGPDQPILFDDELQSVFDVTETGRFRWHTNPSTRPIVAKDRGSRSPGEPAPAERQTGGPGGAGGNDPAGEDNLAGPCGAALTSAACLNEHLIVVPQTGDNQSANVRVSWPSPVSDWDIELFEDLNNNGNIDKGDKSVGSSGQGATSEEEVGFTAEGDGRLEPGKRYLLRVVNYAAGEPYNVDIRWNAPAPFKAGQVEAYTLTCETPQGAVLATREVTVDRGQKVDAGKVCPADAAQILASRRVCAGASGFARTSVNATKDRRGLRFGFRRFVARPVTVDVFQTSNGRRIFGERRVARFTGRTGGFTWDGKATAGNKAVRDGVFFARFRIKGRKRLDFRRATIVRRNGRFSVRRTFYRPNSCGLLASAKLERPAFGGRTNRPLRVAFRVARTANVRVTVLRGSRMVRTIQTNNRRGRRTHRLRIPSEGLRAKGIYRVTITAVRGGKRVRTTLVAQRL